jgi:hypothetical protein
MLTAVTQPVELVIGRNGRIGCEEDPIQNQRKALPYPSRRARHSLRVIGHDAQDGTKDGSACERLGGGRPAAWIMSACSDPRLRPTVRKLDG